MKFEIPENIRKYVEDESSVPLIAYNRSLWYHITKEEKAALVALVRAIDSVPESEWRKWDEKEIIKWSAIGNNADRIARQSIVKEIGEI